jgi:hypothetical protein
MKFDHPDFARYLHVLFFTLCATTLAGVRMLPEEISVTNMKAFSAMGKEQEILVAGKEAEILR